MVYQAFAVGINQMIGVGMQRTIIPFNIKLASHQNFCGYKI
jgi:hypothetical protein